MSTIERIFDYISTTGSATRYELRQKLDLNIDAVRKAVERLIGCKSIRQEGTRRETVCGAESQLYVVSGPDAKLPERARPRGRPVGVVESKPRQLNRPRVSTAIKGTKLDLVQPRPNPSKPNLEAWKKATATIPSHVVIQVCPSGVDTRFKAVGPVANGFGAMRIGEYL